LKYFSDILFGFFSFQKEHIAGLRANVFQNSINKDYPVASFDTESGCDVLKHSQTDGRTSLSASTLTHVKARTERRNWTDTA